MSATPRSRTEWAKNLYVKYRAGIALVDIEDQSGARHTGTAFHVGEGVYVTAAHVLRGNRIVDVRHELEVWRDGEPVLTGPFFHPDGRVDVACFTLGNTSRPTLPLGGHLDDWISDDAFLLWPTVVIGFPPIPLARPVPFVVTGEINAVVDLYVGAPHPRFIISTMARGGFSGAPVFTGYSEQPEAHGDILGIVTESLLANDAPEETGFMAVLSVEAIFTCLEENDLLPAVQGEPFEGLFKVRGAPEQPALHRGLQRVQKHVETRFNVTHSWWTQIHGDQIHVNPALWSVLSASEQDEFRDLVAAELSMMTMNRAELFVDGVQVAMVELFDDQKTETRE